MTHRPSRGAQPRQSLPASTILVNRYRIVRALKSGGMGSIYLAADNHLGARLCAIKEMLDEFQNEGDRQEGQEWFAREAQMLGRLRHECIPEIYDYFVENGRFYLCLEFIEGENLEDRLARQGTPGMPEKQVLQWASQICEVLNYLHSQTPPIIFRDLKPANIMVAPDDSIRLVDFGIARVFSAVRSATMVGTPGYSPPEQYQGLADPLSDLYALAATTHHLLTGNDPREHPPFAFQPIQHYSNQLSEASQSLLEGALRLELSERGPPVNEFGRQARRITVELAQGLVPGLGGSLAAFAPGDPLPPTRMAVPFGGLSFGRFSKGEEHMVNFPVMNEGPHELRTTLHANVSWIHVPEGQLRVPCGSRAPIPIRLDTTQLPTGLHRASIELDGNGGTVSVPVEVRVAHWLFNPVTALMLICVSFAAILGVVTHLFIQYLHP